MSHDSKPVGDLGLTRVPALVRPPVLTVRDAMRYGTPQRGDWSLTGLARRRWQRRNAENFERSLRAQNAAQEAARGGAVALLGHLWLAKVHADGFVLDLGLAGARVVTTAGVNYIVDAFQNLTELENLKFHGIGTGTTAEATSQTALVTELTTQYSTANTRPTGTLGEQSGNSNVFESVATITVSAAVAITEHGLFSQAATGGGTMLDRTLFAAVNLASGDSLQATYDFTVIAGG